MSLVSVCLQHITKNKQSYKVTEANFVSRSLCLFFTTNHLCLYSCCDICFRTKWLLQSKVWYVL